MHTQAVGKVEVTQPDVINESAVFGWLALVRSNNRHIERVRLAYPQEFVSPRVHCRAGTYFGDDFLRYSSCAIQCARNTPYFNVDSSADLFYFALAVAQVGFRVEGGGRVSALEIAAEINRRMGGVMEAVEKKHPDQRVLVEWHPTAEDPADAHGPAAPATTATATATATATFDLVVVVRPIALIADGDARFIQNCSLEDVINGRAPSAAPCRHAVETADSVVTKLLDALMHAEDQADDPRMRTLQADPTDVWVSTFYFSVEHADASHRMEVFRNVRTFQSGSLYLVVDGNDGRMRTMRISTPARGLQCHVSVPLLVHECHVVPLTAELYKQHNILCAPTQPLCSRQTSVEREWE